MPFRLLHIELEDLDIEISQKMGLIIKDKKQDCEIELSPEITAQLLVFGNLLMLGFNDALKKGLIDKSMLSPDWK